MRQTWSSVCKHILWCPTKIPFLPPLNCWERLRPCAFHDPCSIHTVSAQSIALHFPLNFCQGCFSRTVPTTNCVFPKWSTVYRYSTVGGGALSWAHVGGPSLVLLTSVFTSSPLIVSMNLCELEYNYTSREVNTTYIYKPLPYQQDAGAH